MKLNVTTHRQGRRVFLIQAAGVAAALGVTSAARAQPAVADTDANAVALGYRADATKADKVKYPTYKAGQACGNCALFQAPAGAAAGACPLFAGKQVSAKAWCSAYAKKA